MLSHKLVACCINRLVTDAAIPGLIQLELSPRNSTKLKRNAGQRKSPHELDIPSIERILARPSKQNIGQLQRWPLTARLRRLYRRVGQQARVSSSELETRVSMDWDYESI